MKTKIIFTTTHSDGSIIRYSAPIVAQQISDRSFWVQIPAKVRALPFPPFNGKKYVLVSSDYAKKWAK